jgi:FkbM family methyltransferase
MEMKQFEFKVLPNESDECVKFVLDYSQFSQKHIGVHFENGQMYEGETFDFVTKNLKKGDTFLDIGTHVGFFSIIASKIVCDSGKVYSFEMNHSNYSHLLAHIKLNNSNNIVPHNWAVSDKSGMIEFFHNQDNDGGHSLWDCGKHEFNIKSKEKPTSIISYSVAIDDYFDAGRKVNFMKIDTEGAEVLVLKGMQNLLKRDKPIVVAEVNEFGLKEMGFSYIDLRKIMSDIGYRCWKLDLPKPIELNENEKVESDYIYNVAFSTENIK